MKLFFPATSSATPPISPPISRPIGRGMLLQQILKTSNVPRPNIPTAAMSQLSIKPPSFTEDTSPQQAAPSGLGARQSEAPPTAKLTDAPPTTTINGKGSPKMSGGIVVEDKKGTSGKRFY